MSRQVLAARQRMADAASVPPRARTALRETVLLWLMRAAILGYALCMVLAAEAALRALHRLF